MLSFVKQNSSHMPNYVYECLNCIKKLGSKIDSLTDEQYEAEVLYEAKHSMDPSEEELTKACECPRCNSKKARRVYWGYDITTYTRGYGYLDKAGATRDMNVYKLTQDDPYKEYREAGEADDIKHKLQRQGQHNPKSKHFEMKITEKDVGKVIHKHE